MKLSIKEYMESRNVSRRTIYNRIENGQLETIKEKNKTYIIKENLNKPITKKIVTQIITNDLSKSEDLQKLKENITLIENSYNIIKDFDYNFLKNRLSAIEKSLISFSMEANKSNEKVNIKSDSLLHHFNQLQNNITDELKNIKNKNDKFLETFLIINEKNQTFFNEKLEKLESKIESLETQTKKIDILIEKFEEIIKNNDKKSFGLFKK